jgi:NAD(P)-dependent dehydrogenase (short-subunit alcohol dehydrogenase family)
MKPWAIVTGANRGLGLELAKRLAKKEWRVVVCAREGAAAEKAAKLVGAEAVAAELDMTKPEFFEAAALCASREWQPLNALVNNAGIYRGESFSQILTVNFFGSLHLTDALVPHLARGANVVMVSSGLGALSSVPVGLRDVLGAPEPDRGALIAIMEKLVAKGSGGDAYAISKAGVNALARMYARELASKRVRVNAVSPGWCRTDMGGAEAPRSVEQGAESLLWGATLGDDGPSGGFFQDGRPQSW